MRETHKVLASVFGTDKDKTAELLQAAAAAEGINLRRVPEWNPDPREECAGGIHFFLTRIEAEEYEG